MQSRPVRSVAIRPLWDFLLQPRDALGWDRQGILTAKLSWYRSEARLGFQRRSQSPGLTVEATDRCIIKEKNVILTVNDVNAISTWRTREFGSLCHMMHKVRKQSTGAKSKKQPEVVNKGIRFHALNLGSRLIGETRSISSNSKIK